MFAQASWGRFTPERVTETPIGEGVEFCFQHAGRDYRLELPIEADEPPTGFYGTINQALEDSGSPLRFLQLEGLPWGPIPGFALTTPQAFAAASSTGLVRGSPAEPVSDARYDWEHEA